MERIGLYPRLREYYAEMGKFYAILRLYGEQKHKLEKDGFKVVELDLMGCQENQKRCFISWEDPQPFTVADKFHDIAAQTILHPGEQLKLDGV